MKLIWDWLEAEIFPLPSLGGERPLFNFYREEDSSIDRPGAAQVRRDNLRLRLESYAVPPDILAVGEAPGWRGCRLTGIPFTSEALFASGSLPFASRPTSRLDRARSEASATLFWRAFGPFAGRVFTWNCIPLHPYVPGRPQSNRSPTTNEMHAYLHLLCGLAAVLRPRQVLAVGRCAQAALREAGIPAHPVRHPSHGGASQFYQDVAAALAN